MLPPSVWPPVSEHTAGEQRHLYNLYVHVLWDILTRLTLLAINAGVQLGYLAAFKICNTVVNEIHMYIATA